MSIRAERISEEMAKMRPELTRVRKMSEAAAADGREMNEAERKDYEAVLAKASSLIDQRDDMERDQKIMAHAGELIPPPAGFGGGLGGGTAGLKSGQRLSFKHMAPQVAAQMTGGYGGGQKALAPSGAAVVQQSFEGDPIALGKVATGLLDVLPVIQHTSPEYAFLRQTTRTNNAAVVAEGAVKPTSAYTLVRIEQSLAVVAHLSEAVPRFWFIDVPTLERFIQAEMETGLARAVEAKVIADIAGTSGIQTQAYSTSVLTTIRKGITKLEVAGYAPSSVVLNPVDFEAVELALSTVTAVEHLSLPFDAATRRLFGVPIASTVSQTAGVGHVLADGAVVVDTDMQGIGIQWSENSNADDFSKNLIRARCEGRYATSVFAPLGVVSLDLTP